MKSIEKDPAAWLEHNRCNNPHHWYKLAETYAESLAVERKEVKDAAIKEWCKRYNLEDDDPLARVLYEIAHTTFKDVADQLRELNETKDMILQCLGALQDRVAFLEGKYKSQDIVVLSNGSPANN